MKKTMIIMASMLTMATAQPAFAGADHHDMGGHKHGEMKNPCSMHGEHHMQGDMKGMKDHKKMKSDMFLVKKEVDGFTVSFHVMKAKEGMQHGGSHNFMVKVEKDGKALTDIVINSKVIHPNKTSESKMLMKMGDWYMAGYDLGHQGQHGIMILFKTADGSKYKTSVYYPKGK